LAWALAEALKPHLSDVERNLVFAAIGAGETFAAIRYLFKSVAVKGIPLHPDLAQQCTRWLHAYVGHESERLLRRLIDDYLVPCSQPGQLAVLTVDRHRLNHPADASTGIRRETG
jgi:hypothetical protein